MIGEGGEFGANQVLGLDPVPGVSYEQVFVGRECLDASLTCPAAKALEPIA
jgi:hypothetical protein